MEEQKSAAREIALSCLLAICEDPEARPTDRLAAAKMLLELDPDLEQGRKLTVVMEGVPDNYLV